MKKKDNFFELYYKYTDIYLYNNFDYDKNGEENFNNNINSRRKEIKKEEKK